MPRLLEILGSKYPIIQGPIGELNDPKMVAAVCKAGGFGMLALGFVTDLENVREMVAGVKSLTDKPFGANLMLAMNPNNEAILEVLAETGVKTVTTSAGSPKNIYPKIKELGLNYLHVTLAAALAKKAADAGAAAVIVSGSESGGLRTTGPESTNLILIPLVCDMVSIPVVAAGGIADRRGYRAAMALGAQGVQIGTAFLASEESPAPRAWKEAIVACGDTATTLLPMGRMAMRTIINPKLGELIASGADLSQEYNMLNAGEAWRTGNFDLFPAGAGQVSALINKIKPVKDIIEEMVS
ncbi:MAG: nitronate monooxygenase [Candidatus Abyssobacteria bacterium SURF_5]|uniref:Nitronate monooxygenase n=1 Tax=Abyssobacteria bacterium (strain SURF_5) TaxID=2093360 RepID=A0A3A4PFS6_ABYX5|nr:MAG: nitronate monooxygenase [Candidatus Abyssubacteria bacterium SURF_5]